MSQRIGRLQFTGEHAASLGWKLTIIAGLGAAILAAACMMRAEGDGWSMRGNPARQSVLLACALVYAVRLSVTLLVFLKRRIPWWEGMIGIVFPLLIFSFLRVGGSNDQPLGWVDGVGIALYLVGSYVGTASELARHLWKRKPENAGRLYTGGLFRRVRHVNYLGDLLLFTGFALITDSTWMLGAPAVMASSFFTIWIPAHEAYLAAKYGRDFAAYAARSKKLVPFIY